MEEKVRVLFVDDDDLMIDVLKRIFAKEPYDCLFASDGLLALQMMAKQRVDVVVCDQNMPGMSGLQLLEEVCRKHRHAMRVMLSGGLPSSPKGEPLPPAPPDLATKARLKTALNQLKQQAHNSVQVHRFIEKPWNNEQLKSVIADMAAIVRANRKSRPA
jgi:serine/threonine-protein kinase